MYYDGGFGMGGMHGAWWIFGALLIGALLFFAWGRPWERGRRQTPHEVLQRRLANGEITPEEYEKRNALLDRDVPGPMD
ncbi:MAG: SHOCT domain-containing protein [Burkholderiales bacterium]